MYKIYEVCVVCDKIRDAKNGWVDDSSMDYNDIRIKRSFTLCAECYSHVSPQFNGGKKQRLPAMPRLSSSQR
jgi:hypothetical protein